jgi:hemolysin III
MNAAHVLAGDMREERRKHRIQLPDYTRGEEVANMVTHIVGGAFAVAAIPMLILTAVSHGDPWAIVSGAIYGVTLLVMFTISSVYHGLNRGIAKRVMRVIDHCDIYFLIAGTYTPILLAGIRPQHPEIAWTIFGVEWALAAVAVTLNAIDLKRYEKISMACYIGMGWCIVAAVRYAIEALTPTGFWLLLSGGIAFTIGAVLYVIGKRVRYIHSIFHVFVLIGCFLQFLAILLYVM